MTHPESLRLWLAALNPALLNGATFGLLALEGAGVPGVPGVVPMLAQAAAIDAGHATLGGALLWGTLGNWLGSLLGYHAARRWRAWLGPRLAQRHTERAERLLARGGAGLIILSRTIGSLRTPVTLVAGAAPYPFGPYLRLSLLGAALHVGVWQTLLWKGGPALLPLLDRWGHAGLLAAAGGALLWALGRWAWTRRSALKEG
ncbi:DedA family protein [Deinococcus multiflagellatus]|uniref:DedA family protein n=1 Tax=Deinococcus multiflagellatus TaxID=1656887 RepID=A0ABW1ZHA1_9DEIO|nr:VTT domain-containing protein [Deinococcus multiflagellatus]MBZ9711814.1 VTT domain-containing protein [Deinococcus multiflagellatus]